MRPVLVVGLGNSLMGDDGVGARIAEELAADAVFISRADVELGGTDLLRSMDRMEGRRQVVLVDAAAAGPPGSISVHEGSLVDCGLDAAHTLSAAWALELLLSAAPLLRDVRFTWVLVGVTGARLAPGLSDEVSAAVPLAVSTVKKLVEDP